MESVPQRGSKDQQSERGMAPKHRQPFGEGSSQHLCLRETPQAGRGNDKGNADAAGQRWAGTKVAEQVGEEGQGHQGLEVASQQRRPQP